MMGPSGLWLYLVGAASVFSRGASAVGAHRLHYTISVFSKNGSVQQGSLAQGYWDGEPFLHYDSETGQAEPRAPWAESHLGARDLVTEKEELGQRGRELRMTMADFQQEGLHSLQETLGCELQEDNTLIGFWEYRCAGELLLDYVPETQSWKLPPSSFQPLAEKIKKKWDLERDRHKDYRHHVQGDTCTKLQKYLIFWNNSQEQTGPSAVSVTCNKTTEHTTGLTCCTLAFSTKHISPTWLHDGQPLNQHNQSRWGDLSRGNVTCVSTEVPQGEEQKYSCRVELGTNSSARPVPCGGTSLPKHLWHIIAPACSVAVVIPMIVYICLRILKRRRTSGQESPAA
ncbi:MHC class I polypeptide-related sequence B isoform X2 [Tenrec ecaudatus]|uniref:MHC class I polypeptide-related sequence B isoform X2 n=1 Tax=Tenrec ecaudatus TaxID=94439 RepID=UPI003F5AC6EF